MSQAKYSLASLLIGGALLSACGGSTDTHTSTPSSMLGTDSAATKVGGTPPAAPTDTTATSTGR